MVAAANAECPSARAKAVATMTAVGALVTPAKTVASAPTEYVLACGDSNTNLSPQDATNLSANIELEQTFCPWEADSYRWFTIELPAEKQCQFKITYPAGAAALKALLYDKAVLTTPGADHIGELSASADPTLAVLLLTQRPCGDGAKFLRVEAKDSANQPPDDWVYTITAKYTD